MNNTENDLLRGILDDPASDERRLVYADWLEESGEAERAEFVRKAVQYPHAEFARLTEGPLHPFYLLGMQDKHSARPWHWGDTGEGVVVTDETAGIMYRPDRGFVNEVRCRLEDWTQHGPVIVACQPVTRVVVTDREPADRSSVNGMWYWFRDGRNALGHWSDGNHLPDLLFRFLTDSASPGTDTIGLPYPTRQAALDALSAACVRWARIVI